MADEEAPKASTSASPGNASSKGKQAVPVQEDSDEDDFDSDDEDLDVDEDFKNELLAALQASGVADDFDAAEEGENDESEEEILDDDQMLALDDKLADIFRMNGGGRNTKKRECVTISYGSNFVDVLSHRRQSTERTTCTTVFVLWTSSTLSPGSVRPTLSSSSPCFLSLASSGPPPSSRRSSKPRRPRSFAPSSRPRRTPSFPLPPTQHSRLLLSFTPSLRPSKLRNSAPCAARPPSTSSRQPLLPPPPMPRHQRLSPTCTATRSRSTSRPRTQRPRFSPS